MLRFAQHDMSLGCLSISTSLTQIRQRLHLLVEQQPAPVHVGVKLCRQVVGIRRHAIVSAALAQAGDKERVITPH